MPAQASSTSPAKRVLDRIVEERFTGLLRVSSHEASGEFWFLAGTLEEARFGVSKGEEARERLLSATSVVFQAELRLPYVNGGFKKLMPTSASFAEFRPVVLMRHCESYALTCALELRGKNRTVRLTYRIGELLSADATPPGNDALPSLLESEEGSYEFVLPAFELPEGVNTLAHSASRLPLAERIDRLLAEESAAAADTEKSATQGAQDENRRAAEAAAAEAKRKEEQAAAAEAQRRAAEAQRKAAEAAAEAEAEAERKAAEAQRKAAEAAAEAETQRKAAEAQRKAAEAAAAAEAQRKAGEAAAAEAQRKAAEAAAAAEAQRKAAEAAAAAQAERAAAEAQAKAERERELEAAAKAKKEAARAEAQPANPAVPSKSEPAKKSVERAAVAAPLESSREEDSEISEVPPKRGFPWFWLFLAALLVALAFFIKERLGLR